MMVVVVAAALLKSATNSTLLSPCVAEDPPPARAEENGSPELHPMTLNMGKAFLPDPMADEEDLEGLNWDACDF